MAQRQKITIWQHMRSNKVTLIAVMLLAVSAGSFAVPRSSAVPKNNYITNATLTPSNTAAYTMTMRWQGSSDGYFEVQLLRGGTLVSNMRQGVKVRAASVNGVVCGVVHTFRIRAIGPEGFKSAYKTATASTRCPSADWVSYGASGNNVASSWRASSGFAQAYTYYLKTGSGGYVASATNATSRTVSGSCSTAYAAYIVPSAGGQNGPATAVRTATTAGCPAPAPAAPKATATPTVKKPVASSVTPKAAAPAVTAALPLGTPANFSAEVSALKIVNLVWEPAANATKYVVARSEDNQNWQDITTVSGSSYTDKDTEFNKTYYYQLKALNDAGQTSEIVTAQAKTADFDATTSAVTSDDKRVSVSIPTEAVNGEYSCTVTINKQIRRTPPNGQRLLAGPYELSCVDDAGEVIDTFLEPVTVSITLGDEAKGYTNVAARSAGRSTWTAEKSTYKDDGRKLSFTLTSTKTFAAFGVEKGSSAGLFAGMIVALLAIGGVIFWLIRRRRTQTVSPAAAATSARAEMTAEEEFRQALAQPDCSHLAMAAQVIPSSQGCLECEQQGTTWKSLRICLVCGHVGCSDDSDQQHALKHYQETGHPIIYDYADPNGNSIGWCYVDQTYI